MMIRLELIKSFLRTQLKYYHHEGAHKETSIGQLLRFVRTVVEDLVALELIVLLFTVIRVMI